MESGEIVTGLVYEFSLSLAPARAAPILVKGFDLVVVWIQHRFYLYVVCGLG